MHEPKHYLLEKFIIFHLFSLKTFQVPVVVCSSVLPRWISPLCIPCSHCSELFKMFELFEHRRWPYSIFIAAHTQSVHEKKIAFSCSRNFSHRKRPFSVSIQHCGIRHAVNFNAMHSNAMDLNTMNFNTVRNPHCGITSTILSTWHFSSLSKSLLTQ